METNTYEQKLNKELESLTEELNTLGIHDPEVKENWIATPEAGSAGNEPDLNDAADEVEDWDERRATLSLLETRYNNVTKALKKIEAGSFGKCEICGNDIEADRLEIAPSARTCKKDMDKESELI